MVNIIDKIVAYVDPKAGLERAQTRAKLNKTRGYDSSTKGRRGDGWTSGGNGSQNQDIQRSAKVIRERSIDGYKNNSNVFRAIRTITNNVVGTGIMPTPIPKPGEKEISKAELKKIKNAWELFVESCDFDEDLNFYGLQSLGARNTFMQGEIFVVRQRDAKNNPVPFKIQILEPHMCDIQKNTGMLVNRPDNFIVQGVEFDSRGRKVGYWLHEMDPKNEFVIKLAPKFVSKEDVIHVFYKEFPSQVRGIPAGTPAMLNMRDLSDYEDAALMSAKVAACHVAFTTQPAPDDPVNDGEGYEGDNENIEHLEPGIIQRLAPGEEVTFNTPPTPQSYGEYVSKNQQKNAAGYGITYEQMTGDMSNVNFSSGRMGWIEADRQVQDWQYNFYIQRFCKPIWTWFIEGLMLKGVINREVWAEWTPQGREMLDPVKETNGLVLKLKAGLISWTEACKQAGYNPDVVLTQIVNDRKMFEENGINVEWIIDKAAEENTAENGKSDLDNAKTTIDAYGVAVRAGAITPIQADEEHFRNMTGLPGMNEASEQAWRDAGGFRTPITLKVDEEPTKDGGEEVETAPIEK